MSRINLHAALRFWAARWPERLAVRCPDEDLTWAALDQRSDRIAAGLIAAGVVPGDRIGILMHNRAAFVETMLGVLKCGAALTLLNIRFTPYELVHPVVDAGISIVVAQTDLAHLLSEAERAAPGLKVYTTERVDGCRLLDHLRSVDASLPEINVGYDDVALVCYTSGTTGFPKGAMLTHGNIRESGISCVTPSGITSDSTLLVSLPMAYTWGSCQYLREALLTGATTVIVDPAAGVDNLIDIIEHEGVTVWSSVVVLWERIAQHRRFHTTDFSRLRNAVTGGASPHLLDAWRRAGVPITQAYGLTETAGHVSLLFAEDADRKRGSSGRAVLNTRIRVVRDDGVDAAPDEDGEILISGPGVMKGYINNPRETERVMSDDWLRTGDIGALDEEGFLRVLDRKKDMLRSGGLNVYPAEIERVLAGIAGLEEFAVIGVHDDRWGEVPMIITHGAVALDLKALKERCQVRLADYKRPHFVLDYGRPLPRTVSGKVVKHDLRREYPVAPPQAARLKG